MFAIAIIRYFLFNKQKYLYSDSNFSIIHYYLLFINPALKLKCGVNMTKYFLCAKIFFAYVLLKFTRAEDLWPLKFKAL